MVVALRAHPVALLERDFIDDRTTGGAFVPQALGHVGPFFSEGTDGALLKYAHIEGYLGK